MNEKKQMQLDLEGLALKYVWSLDGDGMSTARGVRTREALMIAYVEGAKSKTNQIIEEFRKMKVDDTYGFDRSVIECREKHNKTIDDFIKIIGGE